MESDFDDDWYSDVYSSPSRYGLTHVGSVDWDREAWSFNLTSVWWHAESHTLYWGDDSGCSCPSPFESVLSLDGLVKGGWQELYEHLKSRLSTAIRGEYYSTPNPHVEAHVASLLTAAKTRSQA